MPSFQNTLRDLPLIGYPLRVVYTLWKLPEIWDVLMGYVTVGSLAGGENETGKGADRVSDLTARVIDLTALVQEQASELAELQQRLQVLEGRAKGVNGHAPTETSASAQNWPS